MAKRSASRPAPPAKATRPLVSDSYVSTDISDEICLMDLAIVQEHAAGQRIHRAVQRLKELGIIDEKGNLVSPYLPDDMQTGSKSTLG